MLALARGWVTSLASRAFAKKQMYLFSIDRSILQFRLAIVLIETSFQGHHVGQSASSGRACELHAAAKVEHDPVAKDHG